MSELSGTQNLIQRRGTWYYNRRVPQHLVGATGRTLIRVSLGTRDKGEAKKRRALKDVEWDARFDALEKSGGQPIAVSELPDVAAVVRAYVDRKTAELDRRLSVDPPSDPDALRDRIVEADQTISILRDPANPELDVWVSRVGKEILSDANAAAPAEGEDFAKFSSLVVRGLVELTRREMALFQGDRSQEFFDHLFDPDRARSAPFRDVANRFLTQRMEEAAANRRSKKWVDKINGLVATIVELVGELTPVNEIDYDACQRMRSLIARLPANRTKHYPKLSALQVIERAEKDGRRTLATHTQADYLATFKGIMEVAAAKKLIGHNPAASLRPITQETLAPHEKRLPLSLDQIAAFFSCDFYRSCAPSAAVPYGGKDRAWRFWLPLICLLMGLRPNEACQLFVSDVKSTKDGIWYVQVDDALGEIAKTIKTNSSRRCVPVHPELLRLGFLDFVEERRKAKDARYLIPGLKPDKYGNRAAYALRRFNETFLPEVIVLEERQSFYSLRHSFRDALRRVDAPPAALKALGGWSQGSLVSDSYGNQFDLGLQAKWIKLLGYPGLDLSFLHVPT